MNEIFSEHNIMAPIQDSDDSFILNVLSRNADILTSDEAEQIQRGEYSDRALFRSKGYLVDPEEEQKSYRRAYLDFIDARDQAEVQVFYVPTYACNFNCSYCYQSEYSPTEGTDNNAVLDAFFAYLDKTFAGRSLYLTLFGGEPLLPGNQSRDTLARFIESAGQRGLGLAVVTNGYHLSDYLSLLQQADVLEQADLLGQAKVLQNVDVLQKADLREIQITLDGPAEVHNHRRPLADGRGSFERIVAGIDQALARKLPINLRVVVDRENISGLPELARFAAERGWTDNPLFKTQLGRNYELHSCQDDQKRLFTRVGLYQALYDLIEKHPEIIDFHRPAYSLASFLFEQGELPDPLFDSCPGCSSEWAFDYTGRIYSCTATVGKQDEALGTFYPRIDLDQSRVNLWKERDVTSIPECSSCGVRLACGGGCAAVAKNQSSRLQSPDCRPVKELLSMGISLYNR